MHLENSDEYFISKALLLAKKAYKNNDVPVGCVIVRNNKIIASGYNKRHKNKNSLKHAEIIAINKACKKLKKWILDDCTLYVTLEPCIMCAGALIQSRIKKVVFGSYEQKSGCCGSKMNIVTENNFNHRLEAVGGVLEEECTTLLKEFFKELRKNKCLK